MSKHLAGCHVLLKIAVEKLPPLAKIEFGNQLSVYFFSCFISVCLFVALLKATKAAMSTTRNFQSFVSCQGVGKIRSVCTDIDSDSDSEDSGMTVSQILQQIRTKNVHSDSKVNGWGSGSLCSLLNTVTTHMLLL